MSTIVCALTLRSRLIELTLAGIDRGLAPPGNTAGGSMKAHSKKGADTRLRIIRAAADLFHKQGVRATSPDQII
jgi:hypothetical protein